MTAVTALARSRSNWTLPSDWREIANSFNTGDEGFSKIAPIGMPLPGFNLTLAPLSTVCPGRVASLIPPPRLVSKSSRSELRRISVFSAKETGVGVGEG